MNKFLIYQRCINTKVAASIRKGQTRCASFPARTLNCFFPVADWVVCVTSGEEISVTPTCAFTWDGTLLDHGCCRIYPVSPASSLHTANRTAVQWTKASPCDKRRAWAVPRPTGSVCVAEIYRWDEKQSSSAAKWSVDKFHLWVIDLQQR